MSQIKIGNELDLLAYHNLPNFVMDIVKIWMFEVNYYYYYIYVFYLLDECYLPKITFFSFISGRAVLK